MVAKRNKFLPFFMVSLPVLFFTYQFILRLWPGLMMDQIRGQFSIEASGFGMLAAFYYYGYSGMQIPVAVMLDRFGVRYVVCCFTIICSLATVLFTYTDNFYLALLSRFLIGAGSAVGFLAVSKAVSQWFGKDQYAKVIGFSFSFGLLGAIYGGKPVSLLIEAYSWQYVALVLALVSFLIGVSTYIFFRSPQKVAHSEVEEFKFASIKSVLTSPIIWLLGISNFLMVGALEGFADVWGISYLTKAYYIKKEEAASIVSLTFLGMIFGGPILAFISKKIGSYQTIMICGLSLTFAFILLLTKDQYNILFLSAIFIFIGIMSCYQVIVFVAGAELVSSAKLGVTIAFLNCINMLGGSFFHSFIGQLMDLLWKGALSDDGIRYYDLETYKYAISIIPICSFLGALIILYICRKSKNFNMV
jgi:MFS family permease